MSVLRGLLAGLAATCIVSATALAGAAGGGTELPANAEKQQKKENPGSTERSGGATPPGASTSVDTGEKGTATGGNAGGPAGRN